MFGYIYKITNSANNKIYIGKTQETPESRFKEHLRVAKRGKKQSYLYSAIKSYGPEYFSVEEIDSANSKEELCEKEKYWISYYNSTDRSIGYNIGSGGEGGFIFDATGKIIVNKDGHNTFINPEDLDKYLNDGWQKGGKKIGSNGTRLKVWINDGEVQKRVMPDTLDSWLAQGWVMGFTEKNKDTLSKSHKGQSPANKGKPCPEDQKKLLSEIWTGSRKMTDGNIVVQAKKNEIESYLEKGFIFMNKKKGGDVNE